MGKTGALTVILDVDGTLVDTNYQHRLALVRSIAELRDDRRALQALAS